MTRHEFTKLRRELPSKCQKSRSSVPHPFLHDFLKDFLILTTPHLQSLLQERSLQSTLVLVIIDFCLFSPPFSRSNEMSLFFYATWLTNELHRRVDMSPAITSLTSHSYSSTKDRFKNHPPLELSIILAVSNLRGRN